MPAIAATAVGLPDTFPGDPADRLIYATAVERGWRLVTKDRRLRDHPTPGPSPCGDRRSRRTFQPALTSVPLPHREPDHHAVQIVSIDRRLCTMKGVDYTSPLQALFPGSGAAVLAVLARTTQPLSMRQIAERAGVSHPQVSRRVQQYEALGVVRREVIGRSHVVTLAPSAAAALIRAFDGLQDEVVKFLRRTAPALEPNALSVTLFGSFARRSAGAASDIDIAIVVARRDDGWLEDLSGWVEDVAVFAGNPVAEIVVERRELAERADDPLWHTIAREGAVLAGRPVAELAAVVGNALAR